MVKFKQLREKLGQIRPWDKGWDPAEFKAVGQDKKIKKDVQTFYKARGGKIWIRKKYDCKRC